ncbi:hypothetical protein EB834_11455 [Brevibacterium aurantiacum]|uniref:Uncharacterized protein n=1 Tax=Brevibacterium aurantiacum TaxID=273384 RepID=A0A4Z0KLN9_BREAU|nr:hypothetical protein EB834_11455 [Brevibacterium aurantiacum]
MDQSISPVSLVWDIQEGLVVAETVDEIRKSFKLGFASKVKERLRHHLRRASRSFYVSFTGLIMRVDASI